MTSQRPDDVSKDSSVRGRMTSQRPVAMIPSSGTVECDHMIHVVRGNKVLPWKSSVAMEIKRAHTQNMDKRVHCNSTMAVIFYKF